MKIVENKDFQKEFPSEVTGIMNDVTIFMNYDIIIQFREEEWDEAWAKLKELKGGGDQVARDSNGFIYIG
jgi:hypothetical protein